MSRRRLTAALAALAMAASTRAAAQKPTPPKVPSPNSNLPGANAVAARQKPDLVVSLEGGGSGLPTGFTVKNIGSADSKVSVLRVTATFVPPATSPVGGSAGCPSFMTQEECDTASGIAGTVLGLAGPSNSADQMRKACGNPFREVIEAVPVLKPGESKTFTRDVGPQRVTISVGSMAQPASTQVTHVKGCLPTLVCVWDVKAVADASNDNDESHEDNNVATRRASREVGFK